MIFPEKYIKPKRVITALWRGYVATFKIVNQTLFVKKIDILEVGGFKLLKEFDYEKPCDWYSGFIRIDDFRGEFDDEENTDATYEFLEINKGDLKKIHRLDFERFIQFKNALYDKFKKTEEYNSLFLRWKPSGHSDKEIEALMYDNFMHYTKDTG